jgi:hypothetical protein
MDEGVVMAYYSTKHDALAVAICEAFGLDPSTVLSLTLRLHAGPFDPPTLEVVHHAEVKVGDKLVDFTRVAKTYELKP